MVSRIVVLCMVVRLACGATWISQQPVKPPEHAHKEGCYIEEIDDVIPFGQDVSPIGVCYRIECSGYQLTYASCGVVYTEDQNCYKTEIDLKRPYPECCPDIKCEVENKI
ncbi:uncharacterized protein LOC116770951 [Danaus plexippus]|uniref:Secreted peptide 30 n=1 Tax=Danaus plexippus plexippus TaxID=278856 RepID=A0A212F8R0_DANPL|nr:uncharacterized protein LOC116770951 [Danaus plexippus]OWR50103.1 putative secreted peptide 30 [Danaus plexippus plexippus]